MANTETHSMDSTSSPQASSGQAKTCQNCKAQFIVDAADFAFYDKIHVPPPTWCPQCRLQRRFTFRNERTLYKRACGLCKKDVITIYSPDKPYTVYCQPCWFSDKWDPLVYGRPYDFSRTFFEQFKALHRTVPLPALNTTYFNLVNSEYVNQAGNLKNCYLLFNSDYSENCAYGSEIESSKDCFDNLMVDSCSLCYGSVNCQKCYRAFWSVDCESCHNIWFSKNLVGCSDCVGCVNLRNQKHCIFNVPYTKEMFETKLRELNLASSAGIAEAQERARELWLAHPQKFMHGRQNRDVSGDYITHSQNVHSSYIVQESQNCRYCLWMIVKPVKDCWDYSEYGDNAERIYECVNCGLNISNVMFSVFVFSNAARVLYSMHCKSSVQDLFGCVSVRNKQYVILNKVYAESEYHELVDKIKTQMQSMPYTDKKGHVYRYGEFFPPQLSPFGYNETTAIEHFPLSKEEAMVQGYAWKDPEERNIKIQISNDKLPDRIKDTSDDIVNQVIECAHAVSQESTCKEKCTTAFKIIPQELDFLRQMNLPLPRLCPNCRHYQRLKQRNPLKLWHRSCQCTNTATHFHGTSQCSNEFETSYDPKRLEMVYCESCYNSEVV